MGSPRITNNSINIDLVMGREGLKHILKQKQYQNDSSTGKIETINLFGRFEYSFDCYFARSVYYTLWAWWAWARQGKEFSFALDSADIGNTTLDAAAAAGQAVIPVVATGAFTAGDVCFVKDIASDDEFELITIDSVSAGVSVTATTSLIYTYASADILRHKDYFPNVKLVGNSWLPEHTGVVDTTGKYYRYTFKFVEAI
jgi:hypothetical protein